MQFMHHYAQGRSRASLNHCVFHFIAQKRCYRLITKGRSKPSIIRLSCTNLLIKIVQAARWAPEPANPQTAWNRYCLLYLILPKLVFTAICISLKLYRVPFNDARTGTTADVQLKVEAARLFAYGVKTPLLRRTGSRDSRRIKKSPSHFRVLMSSVHGNTVLPGPRLLGTHACRSPARTLENPVNGERVDW